jgi:hypothetical protein
MIGKEVNLELTDGTALTGVLHTNTLFTAQKLQGLRFPNQVIVLKSSKLVKVSASTFSISRKPLVIVFVDDSQLGWKSTKTVRIRRHVDHRL